MIWTLADAKNQLSQVVRRAVEDGPRTISVRGRETAVVMAKDEYDRLNPAEAPRDFKAFLLSIPSLDGIDLSRDETSAARISLPMGRSELADPAWPII